MLLAWWEELFITWNKRNANKNDNESARWTHVHKWKNTVLAERWWKWNCHSLVGGCPNKGNIIWLFHSGDIMETAQQWKNWTSKSPGDTTFAIYPTEKGIDSKRQLHTCVLCSCSAQPRSANSPSAQKGRIGWWTCSVIEHDSAFCMEQEGVKLSKERKTDTTGLAHVRSVEEHRRGEMGAYESESES